MGSWGVLALTLVVALCDFCEAELLTPPYFNLAEGRKITASATCGEGTEGPELYCKLVGANSDTDIDANVIGGQTCYVCDPTRPDKRHPPEYAVDGLETWWQSPPLSRGVKYNEVNLTIDLGQEFHVAYIYIKMANSPRPGLWFLEKSADYGKTWQPWQYFSDSPAECESNFGRESLQPITRDDSVICTTEYSKIVPLEGGEIPISLLNNRPSANDYFNSTVLQEWTRATNIRFRFLRTKNLLGHLMSVARQDPTVTRRYFYSIKDISIGGRCMCNGHADTCDIQDLEDPSILFCRCQHNTCGSKCQTCCPGYEQKAWRQSKPYHPFICEPCNCFQHSYECTYDPEVDRKRLSLDIYGRYEGGGVCQNCQHNTEGINCNRCKPTYFRPYNRQWNETDVCQPCRCNYDYSTGNCAEGSGQCECRKEFNPPNCDSCSFGYYDFPNCKPCDCHLNGTRDLQCEAYDGQCPCLYNFGGQYCKECAEEYYGFPDCNPCQCNRLGSVTPVCHQETGNCTCKNNYAGKQCDTCQDGYFSYPGCTYCNCDVKGTKEGICDKNSGICLCKEGYGGDRCDKCVPGFYGYPDCKPCNCSSTGSRSTVCDISGKCPCLVNFAGRTCEQCSPGYYQYPECLSCNCEQHGSIGVSCDSQGVCQCHHNFDGDRCEKCREGFYNFPSCEDCNCNPAGVVAAFAGCGSVPAGELCRCKDRVQGRICDQCKPLYWNLSPYNPDGCEECNCHIPGVLSGIGVCDSESGQCACKPSVVERGCTQCKYGTYNLLEESLFGCQDCGCDIGGSVSNHCDKNSGQCPCQARVTGRTCKEPLQAHYFPSLYQFQYEVEDGRTPAFTPVRYAYDEEVFPNYSWKGYAVFSLLQKEILQEVYIFKPSLYRLVLRYVNKGSADVYGTIKVIPDNPNDNEQDISSVQFKSSPSPAFVTISVPLVMNPGHWTFKFKVEKNLFLDYFVLLPEDFYLAAILNQKIESPCTINEKGLCREYGYPNISYFDTTFGSGGFVKDGTSEESLKEYFDDQHHLFRTNVITRVPLLKKEQPNITYNIAVSKPGRYVLVVNYLTPIYDQRTHKIPVEVVSDNVITNSNVVLYSCVYTTLCRQAITNPQTGVGIFYANGNYISLTFKSEDANVGIHSVVAIPYESWSLDYIRPKAVCVSKNGVCLQGSFQNPPESKKIQFEQESESGIVIQAPVKTFNTTAYVYLNPSEKIVDVRGKVPQPGHYVFIVQYYQPDFPEFNVSVLIQNGEFYESKLPVPHCPSSSGCRSAIYQDGINRFSITENFMITFTLPEDKNLYLDYLLVVPAYLYTENILEEQNLDRTGEFVSTCGSNHFNVDTSEEGFCKDSVFSITAGYNNGALPCGCDFDGSLSLECNPHGGQCVCKENIIGRKCEACKTGYYGFPDCKPCNCPTTAHCEPSTGQCICPPHVTGEKCDQCMAFTYGYDPIIGCEECKCHPLGVERGVMQCDLNNGSCPCKPNIVGRKCDTCEAGFYSFPYCDVCECDLRGTTENICAQDTAECYCKKNVRGPTCGYCSEGTYNLRGADPDGCTECFCFGKTTRCTSSNLVRIVLGQMNNWTLVEVNETDDLEVRRLNFTVQNVDEFAVGVDFTSDSERNKSAYFAAPIEYLGKKISAYGGILNFTIYYTIDLNGRAVSGADLILEGADTYLRYESLEQPPAATEYQFSVALVEDYFELPSGSAAKREHIMTVLQDLRGIYLRANYWSVSVTTRLSNVLMEDAVPYGRYARNADLAVSVEECQCPPNYRGLSCEECAPGYYRVQSGPHGGYCVPCQCNGHSNECDVNTGLCLNCNHNTRGEHCEQCAVGYHGNALAGTPMDCLICACPLPIASNNFATSCDLSTDGERISCDCIEGYFGARCESCAPGHFGTPEVAGAYCRPCECSGNINPEDPRSCDTVTGDCLNCLNNTFGQACALCAPGFFGDAVAQKDCQACVCDRTGTDHCDSFTGECKCKPNVTGDKCDRCIYDHYGFQSGRGCVPCECAEASESTQCEDNDGQCRCKEGVTGRTCDRCASGYWNYGPDGCASCGCKSEYSRGFGCNARTGQCECLPGVVGEKCDQCPRRWAFVADFGCTECDSCVHVLIDDTDELSALLDPVFVEFDKAQWGFFTSRRLIHINDTLNELRPLVDKVSPEQGDLKPIFKDLETLELDSKNMNRKVNYSLENSENLIRDADRLRESVEEAQNKINHVSREVSDTVDEINNLSVRLSEGEGPKIDNAVQEAQKLLSEMKIYNLSGRENGAKDELQKVDELLDKLDDFKLPVDDVTGILQAVRDNLTDFNRRLDDLDNQTQYSFAKTVDAENLLNKPFKEKVSKKFENIANQLDETKKNLNISEELLTKAENLHPNSLPNSVDFNYWERNMNEFNNTLEQNVKELEKINALTVQVEQHAKNLSERAQELDNLLSETRDSSTDAVKAANAYKDIVDAVQKAEEAAAVGLDAAKNSEKLLNGTETKSYVALEKSSSLLDKARDSRDVVGSELEPPLKRNVSSYGDLEGQHLKNKELLDNIDKLLAQQRGSQRLDPVLGNAQETAELAEGYAVSTNSTIVDQFKELPTEVKLAKQIPNDALNTTANIQQVEKQLKTINDKLPEVLNAIQNLPDKEKRITGLSKSIEDKIKTLKAQIDTARDYANRIKVGVKFIPSTVLELRNPPNIADLSTSTQISGYFRTSNPNGLILYLGNEVGTNLRRTKTDDFMALIIQNGYPVLILDIGNGHEQIINNKSVADNNWYQFIIDRTGHNAALTIREELPDGTDRLHTSELPLEGPYSIFNLDKDKSKLCVGSCSSQFRMQEQIPYNSFEGEIEDLVVGDTPVGLWNFNNGYENNRGAYERNRLVNLKPSTGYRFNGNGYAVLDGRSHSWKQRSEVQLKFKTFETEGLLFLAGNKTFVALELRNGRVLYKYNLGQETKIWHTSRTYNDGEWHKVTAARAGSVGKFYVDDEEILNSNNANVGGTVLAPFETIFFGGYPNRHNLKDVTNTDFDGCIDEVSIMGTPVDLSQNADAYDVTPGCPIKVARLVSFADPRGYLKRDSLTVPNNFKLSLKFKTKNKDGLIFYANDQGRDASISLSLRNGRLVLISQKIELTSKHTFNDSEWHVVTVVHNANVLRFDFDDYGQQVTDMPPSPLYISSGDLYIGGLPSSVVPSPGSVGSAVSFVGCIGDATLNGSVINFANVAYKSGAILGKCVDDFADRSGYDIHTVPTLKPLEELTPVPPTEVYFGSDAERTDSGISRGDIVPPTVPSSKVLRPPPTIPTTPKPPETEESCALPLVPETNDEALKLGSYRFATKDSRLEYNTARGKYKRVFDFSLEFKTPERDGIILYASDSSNHTHFVGLFLQNGHIVYSFRGGEGNAAVLRSPGTYDDDKWHLVQISRDGDAGKLVIDGQLARDGRMQRGVHKIDIVPPFYVGGLKPSDYNLALANLNTTTSFKGCIQNLNMNFKPMENPIKYGGAIPCSENVEMGAFFGVGGGYIRLRDKFKVGIELDIKLEIKPRNSSGILIAVHGRYDYLVLEMDHGVMRLTVENGKGPITTSFTPSSPYYFCDGRWHIIQAVKSKSVVTLSVDNVFTNPGIGDTKARLTNTGGSLFLGGHRLLHKARGLGKRIPYAGCVRNVYVNNQYIPLLPEMAEGKVTVGSCPTN